MADVQGDPPGLLRPGGSGGLSDGLDDLIDRFDRVRHRPAVSAALLAVVVAAVVGVWWWGERGGSPPLEEVIPLVDVDRVAADLDAASGTAGAEPAPSTGPGDPGRSAGDAVGAEAPATMIVHVVGAVRRPGLVELPPGSRIADALDAAGGGTGSADPHRLNLAMPVVDGMRIRVPTAGEEPGSSDDGGAGSTPADGPDPLVSVPVPEGGPGSEPGPVDLNTADAALLDTLPGVGPAIAAAIVDWRTEHGPFRSVDDLQSVPGIGPAKLGALRDLVVV